VCRIETKEMAETLAGMLNHAFSLGAANNYQAKWDQLRQQIHGDLDDELSADDAVPTVKAITAGTFDFVLARMDEIEGAPSAAFAVSAALLDPAEPGIHPGGPGPPRQPGGPDPSGQLPGRDKGHSAECEAGS
jgi:hypothetical protein